MAIHTDAVKSLQRRRHALIEQLGRIDIAVRAVGGIRSNHGTTRRKPKFTKAGLERIVAAQRAPSKKAQPAKDLSVVSTSHSPKLNAGRPREG